MRILIDNGHGENTPGKRSPDGLFREWKFAREIAEDIERELKAAGYDAERIVRESVDVPLAERVLRVNEACAELGAANVVLVSVHCNAAGNGEEWKNARGWSVYTSKGQTQSDELATMMYVEAGHNFAGQTIRREFSDKDPDWEEDFYILKKTKCAAVLTENFFMDNQSDVSYMLSLEGKRQIVKMHVDALINYVAKYGKS